MRHRWIILVLLFDGCIDPAVIDVPAFQYQLVVDGSITTEPGPYTVKLYRSRPLGSLYDLDRLIAEKSAKIILKDDVGNSELLTETDEGIYQTKINGIRGETGRKYHLEIMLGNGKQYESSPDEIRPVGEVTSINYQFIKGAGIEYREGDGYRIVANATGVPGQDDLVRLRMIATFKVETFPYLKTKIIGGPNGERLPIPDPFPCSGFINDLNQLVWTKDCECCICWVNIHDEVPIVLNERFISGDMFLDEEIGFIPLTRRTFYEKVRIEVQELSLTPDTYQFWKLVKAQKEGISDLFQPPSALIKGNIKAVNNNELVLGIFWAAGVHSKVIYLERDDAPYFVQRIDTLISPCTYFQYSTTSKPSFWQ